MQEDLYERKIRMKREEEEEKREEEEILAFKARKRPSKRKKEKEKEPQPQRKKPRLSTSHEEGVSQDPQDSQVKTQETHSLLGVLPEGGKYQEGVELLGVAVERDLETRNVARDMKAGKRRLLELRKRMAEERLRIINYMDVKRMEEILPDIEMLWVQRNSDMKAGRMRTDLDWIPSGWTDWWRMVHAGAQDQARELRIQQAVRKKEEYQDRVARDRILIGWRAWWSRMMAEAKRELAVNEKEMSARTHTKPIKSYFKTRNSVIDKPVQSGWKTSEEGGSSSSTLSGQQNVSITPKRKVFLQPSVGESPLKKRKLPPIFLEKLLYWRNKE